MSWLSVQDALPAYGKRVLVRDVMVRIGTRDRTDKDGDLWKVEMTTFDACVLASTGDTRGVTHWMELPT